MSLKYIFIGIFGMTLFLNCHTGKEVKSGKDTVEAQGPKTTTRGNVS